MDDLAPRPGRRRSLSGRSSECALLDDLASALRRGESRSLVVRGEAGIGKTALLEYLVESASDLTVVRAVGVESEMELAYASLHQLCGPMLDRLRGFPLHSARRCEIVFGLSAGAPPDRFLVGLAVLSLFSEVAEERPLLCVVDDAQWLDQASALTLAFVARRLLAEPVGIVFAAREPRRGACRRARAGGRGPARTATPVRCSARRCASGWTSEYATGSSPRRGGIRWRLLELPRGLTATQLAGGFRAARGAGAAGRIEESFVRQLEALVGRRQASAAARRGRAGRRSAAAVARGELLGIESAAAERRGRTGCLAIGERVTFRHPLVRSAMYRSATVDERRAVASGVGGGDRSRGRPGPSGVAPGRGGGGPRRARSRWSWSARRAGPGAWRGCRRGGVSAARRRADARIRRGEPSARSPPPSAVCRPARSTRRCGLLATAEAGPLDELQRARVDLLRGQIAFASSIGGDGADAAAEGRQAARAARRRARARDLSGRLGGGVVRRGLAARADSARRSPRRCARPRDLTGRRVRPICCCDGLSV